MSWDRGDSGASASSSHGGAWTALYVTLVALLVALLAASLLVIAFDESPARVFALVVAHTLGEPYGAGQALFRATTLVFTGLSVALAHRAGLFNVGAEGQLVAGSFACAALGAALPAGTPAVLALPAVLLAAAAAGGAVGAIPGVLRARFGAHEVITTIMLNFVVSGAVLFVARTWLFAPETIHTRAVVPGATIPALGLGGSAVSWAALLALACALGVTWLLTRSRFGFELRAVGQNPDAARAGGVNVGRMTVIAMAAAGALAGLAGSGTVLGYKHYFEKGLGADAGFTGIAVALLARGNPLAVLPAALLFALLAEGGLAAGARVPREIVDVMLAVIVIVLAVAAAETRRVRASAGDGA